MAGRHQTKPVPQASTAASPPRPNRALLVAAAALEAVWLALLAWLAWRS